MTDPATLYGTTEAPAPVQIIRQGDVTLELQSGALRHIRVNGTEIIRSVAFLVRDRDWGTVIPELGGVQEQGDSLTLPMTFRTDTALLQVALTIQIGAQGIRVAAKGHVTGDLETNRAGFTVLHPIEGVAGCPATVTHPDGSREDSRFPLLIDPWQPFIDIAALQHRANGYAVRCAFSGDVFEMEDQRQWGDASFKTYNRPLALPWPYVLGDGEVLEQAVQISWQQAPTETLDASATLPTVVLPDLALVLDATDARDPAAVIAALQGINPQRLLCHVDATLGDTPAQFAAFAALQAALLGPAYDLELICRFDDASPDAELADHASVMRAAGFAPASVMVCPSVDRQSTPPGSDWPACPALPDIHRAAALAFPNLPRGGGMASFFPELNRKRPPTDLLDFITHGLCPIVHAADDLSVIETLQAVPHIARSARAIAGGRGYRIGPSTIAMRQNPYGSRTIPNPDGGRVCMTDDDPRHRAAFGAAYAFGLATALAPFGPQVWTLAAVLGPRGVAGDWPIREALAQLARAAGQPVHRAEIRGGIAELQVGRTLLRANLTAQEQDGLPPFGWQTREL